ncbi:MAG: hypothetical protein PHR26_01650 [Candidatus ainarchaeum sp.]|nr:hypothetical protein [Candidatus ainarchaeum sp.]MDD3975872.1 hypothetical protein [Candidatus ainarchaeum sp.]
MDINLSFKKYFENLKISLLFGVLFIFILFLINPIFSLFGGTLNISYNILNIDIFSIIFGIIAVLILIFIYSLIQTMIIYKIGKDYNISENIKFNEIKDPFYKLLKFNWILFLLIYGISVVLYDLNLLNNIIINILFLIITISLWFVPQIIIIQKEKTPIAMYYSIIYWKNNWQHLITLFLTSFILILIANILDALFKEILGIIISTAYFVLFVIPFIEILKTEIYLNKYKLLKPKHQFKKIKKYKM